MRGRRFVRIPDLVDVKKVVLLGDVLDEHDAAAVVPHRVGEVALADEGPWDTRREPHVVGVPLAVKPSVHAGVHFLVALHLCTVALGPGEWDGQQIDVKSRRERTRPGEKEEGKVKEVRKEGEGEEEGGKGEEGRSGSRMEKWGEEEAAWSRQQ